jgi:hypothetical protein
MRTLVVFAILLLGISSAWPEPEHAAMVPGSLVSSAVAAVPPVQTMEPVTVTAAPSGAQAPSGQAAGSAPIPTAAEAGSTPAPSLDKVCNTLFTSAEDNDLPVAFFANLIWQESRLRNNAVSPKGAMGIAQFMPKVAAKSGVENPFDPSQALPASAKLLRELFDRFGNLGYVAAAYNAGTQRVLDWLERGRSLPRETRNYVMDITGRSIEAWRKTPADDALRFARALPCRGLPAFAELVQAQAKQAGLQARAQVTPSQQATPAQQAAPSQQATASPQKPVRRPQEVAKAPAAKLRARHARLARDARSHKPIRRKTVRITKRERPRINREAHEHIRYLLREQDRRA